MSKDISLPKTTNVDTVTGLTESNRTGRSNTSYTITQSYRNNLGYPICIIDRSNVVVTLPPASYSRGSSEFIIEHRLNFSDNVNINWDTVLNEAASIPTIEAIRSIAKQTTIKTSTIGHEFIIEYTLSHSKLADNGFSVYLEELDIAIAKTELAHSTVHPYSAIGQNLVVAGSDNLSGFYYRVVINDPYSEYGERFINVNGAVFKVRRTIDNTIKPGVYVYSKDQCKSDDLYSPDYGTQYYNFNVADKEIGLYGTSHLAASLGDMYIKQEQEMKENESEIKKKMIQLNIQKLELDSKLEQSKFEYKEENLILERENLRLKDELEREKAKRDNSASIDKYELDKRTREQKDFYETRSYERKDMSEFLKWLPTLLTGILAIANLVIAAHGKSAK